MDRAAAIIATWFGSGLLPKAPGTWGSLAAMPPAIAIAWAGAPWMLAPAAVVLFPIGVWAAARYDAARGGHDSPRIVVDEVVGVWLVLSVMPFDWPHFLLALIGFRLFDIAKPWPVRLADRRLGGGFGVMADDVLAAVYAIAALALIGWPVHWSFA